MLKIFVLVVITHVNSGAVTSFQEFNSQYQCNYVKDWTVKQAESHFQYAGLVSAACFEK